MSILPTTQSTAEAQAKTPRRWLRVAVVIGVLALLAGGAVAVWLGGKGTSEQVAVFVAKRGPLTISVRESGQISSRDPVVLKSEVKGRTAILSLATEGSDVEEGDMLVELDASELEELKVQQQIRVANGEAAYIRAKETRVITASQGESDVAKAELEYRFAKLDHKKYVAGEYPKQLQEAEADITIAREELERATDKLEWSARLEKEGYITQAELLADELAVKQRKLGLELAETELELLKEFTHQRQITQLTSNVEQAEKSLERAKRKAMANNIQADADLKAKESEFSRQTTKLEEVIEQIGKCKIVAPVAGRVVHATTGRGRWRGMGEPIQQGSEVGERDELIYLQTSTSLMAVVGVPEASLPKVQEGLPARITVEAVPGQIFSGEVGKMDQSPDPYTVWRKGLTVYPTEVHLESSAGELRVGMTCEVAIIVEEHDDVVYVPVQSVIRVGEQTVVYVKRPDGVKEMREITAGLDNNQMVHIIDGLAEGEEVLLAPPLAESTAPMDNGNGAAANGMPAKAPEASAAKPQKPREGGGRRKKADTSAAGDAK
ncbi:MAG: efflux RND transporter periplasmic adaptor subunit [Planctomycetota bacterium]|jgi:HlyD family secretion protein